MAAVSLLGSTINTTAGAKTVTATPAVGDLIVIVVYHTGDATWSNPTDNNSSGTYDLVGSIVALGTQAAIGFYVRTALISSASSTVFTAPNPGSDTGGGLAAIKVTGMSKFGSAAVRQYKSATPSSGSPAATGNWTSAKLTSNPVIGALLNGQTSRTAGPTSGYTELFETSYTTPDAQCQAQYIDNGDTTNTMNWTGTVFTSGMDGVVMGIELDASAAGNMMLMF